MYNSLDVYYIFIGIGSGIDTVQVANEEVRTALLCAYNSVILVLQENELSPLVAVPLVVYAISVFCLIVTIISYLAIK